MLAGLAALAALVVLPATRGSAQAGSNPCDPRAGNPCNPCNPCSAKARKDANPCNPCRPRNPCNPCGPRNPCNPCGAGAIRHSPEIEELIDEFMAAGQGVEGRPGGDDAVEFPGPADKPNWAQALVVTRVENPLLTEECKKEALQLSVDTLASAQGIGDDAAFRAAANHMRDHRDFVRSHGISYSGYLKEIAECRAFCGPLVANLVKCQVLSVARSIHGIVLFGIDRDRIDPRFDRGIIANVATQLAKDPDRKVVLIGRASRIGDLKYNRRLSARRALAVRDRLLAREVSPEKIETMWFGWEPPQITSWIADEYGMREIFRSEGQAAVNQSVMLVIY